MKILTQGCLHETKCEMLSKLIKITKRKVINSQINKGFITSHNLLKSKLFAKEYLEHNFKLECQYYVGIFQSIL